LYEQMLVQIQIQLKVKQRRVGDISSTTSTQMN